MNRPPNQRNRGRGTGHQEDPPRTWKQRNTTRHCKLQTCYWQEKLKLETLLSAQVSLLSLYDGIPDFVFGLIRGRTSPRSLARCFRSARSRWFIRRIRFSPLFCGQETDVARMEFQKRAPFRPLVQLKGEVTKGAVSSISATIRSNCHQRRQTKT